MLHPPTPQSITALSTVSAPHWPLLKDLRELHRRAQLEPTRGSYPKAIKRETGGMRCSADTSVPAFQREETLMNKICQVLFHAWIPFSVTLQLQIMYYSTTHVELFSSLTSSGKTDIQTTLDSYLALRSKPCSVFSHQWGCDLV